MIRRWLRTWEAVFLLAIIIGGSAAYVSAQMTGARLPLQGVGIWGYDPNLGSFFSVRIDKNGTLIISFLSGGGLASVVPGVGPSGFFLVSIYPAFGGLDRFLVSQIGLGSVGGQVDVRGTGPGGSVLVSQWSGAGGGGGMTSVYSPIGCAVCAVLVSAVDSPWRPVSLASVYIEQKGGGVLSSLTLVTRTVSQRIAVYGLSLSLSSLASVAFYSSTAPFAASRAALWSLEWGPQYPFTQSGPGLAPKPVPLFLTERDEHLFLVVDGGLTARVRLNLLWSVGE